jgi:hypothetical protein
MKSISPVYRPGRSAPVLVSTVIRELASGCNRPPAGVMLSQLAEEKPCQLIAPVQPLLVFKARSWLPAVLWPAEVVKARFPRFVVTPQRDCTVKEIATT